MDKIHCQIKILNIEGKKTDDILRDVFVFLLDFYLTTWVQLTPTTDGNSSAFYR